jgi:arginine decarboxylase
MGAFSLEKGELSQKSAPVYEALQQYKSMRVVPFDVPGHKQGRGNPELTEFLGKDCLAVDVNSMKPLDNLTHPVSVIKDAEMLAAQAFGAAHAFFIVNGTTAAVQAMILSVCHPGDEIILPRNVHRSAIAALVLCGAVPVYVNPGVDKELGIPLGMALEDVRQAILSHPNAKAVLVNNPTYYGVCSNLSAIVTLAHQYGMKVLADEAHGTHFYFHDHLPVSAMAAGADLASVSMHKTGGSLTQSSLLLAGPGESEGHLRQIINLTQTTSASYLLLSSLDVSRRSLALHGEETFDKVMRLAQYARDEINRIGGYYAFSKERVNGDTIFDYDTTKLSVFTRSIGLAGIEVYDLLRDEYGIQVEFGDLGNFLAVISVGDREREIERLVSALSEIKRRYAKDPAGLFDHEYIHPQVVMTPQKAFYADKESRAFLDSAGRICTESIMSYPPGIPIIAPGELVTQEIIDYIVYAKAKGCNLTGAEDIDTESIFVVRE